MSTIERRETKGLGKKSWINLIKVLVTILLVYVLYRQVFARDDLPEIYAAFLNGLEKGNNWPLILVILLMPLNWLLETTKWRLLLKSIEQISFFTAFKGILAGIALSIFTPNRIGEYGGRILVVRPENNLKAILATLVGSFSQLVVLLSLGGIGLVWFVSNHLDIDSRVTYGLIGAVSMMTVLLVFCYLNVDLILPLLKRIRFLKKVTDQLTILADYQTKILLVVLTFSLLRYIVYCTQYYCWLMIFGVQMDYWSGMGGIAMIFLLQTSIPLPPLGGLIVRGELGLYVWGFYKANDIAVLSATFSLWLLNIILPAILGLIVILRTNLYQTLWSNKQVKDQEKSEIEI